MRTKSIASLAAVLLIAAPATAQDQDVTSTPEYVQAYDTAFRAAFRKSTIEQCILSAKSSAYFDLTPTCSCLADTLLATKTVAQLSQISSDPKLKAELEPITMQCLKTAPPLRSERG
jgi:hypothetical protein